MIINLSIKEGKKALFVTENKTNVRDSKSGKAVSFMVGEKATIILSKDGKETKLTGKELITKLFW